MGTSVGLGRVGELPPLLEWIPRVSPELAADTSHLQGVGEVFERARLGEAVRVVCTVPIRQAQAFTSALALRQEWLPASGWGLGASRETKRQTAQGRPDRVPGEPAVDVEARDQGNQSAFQ